MSVFVSFNFPTIFWNQIWFLKLKFHNSEVGDCQKTQSKFQTFITNYQYKYQQLLRLFLFLQWYYMSFGFLFNKCMFLYEKYFLC